MKALDSIWEISAKVGSRWRFRQERIDRWMEDMAVDTATRGRSDDVRG